MAIITLLSDWGLSDYYVAAVKGTILSKLPTANIIDISHNIRPYDIAHAGFVIKNCYRDFPEGTIHILAVNTTESANQPHVVVKAEGQYFISTDNGIFSHFLENGFEEAVTIEVPQDSDSYTFCTRDRFAKVAVMLANHVPLSEIGTPRKSLNIGGSFQPIDHPDTIDGMVTYIDYYGNAITNISRTLFNQVQKGRKCVISFNRSYYTIEGVSDTYDDAVPGELVAIFGSHGFLEIAMNMSNAASLCGIELRSEVRVTFC